MLSHVGEMPCHRKKMEREKIINEIIDFIEGQGRFSERKKYVGMSASLSGELFDSYFESLDSSSKKKAAQILTESVLGNCKELIPHMAVTTRLLASLCRRYGRYFQCGRKALEKEFNDSENHSRWINAKDIGHTPTDLSYKEDWHYSLKLYGILCCLGSDATNDSYHYLLGNSRSQRFRESLVRSRETLEKITMDNESD
jgi:hypothetical protein